MEIKRDGFLIEISKKNCGFIESRSVEANLLCAILEKLEEIRCGIVDVEDEIKWQNEQT